MKLRPGPVLARWLLRAVTLLISIPFLYFVVAGFGAVIPGPHPQIAGGPAARIGLIRGPIHYDFLLPASEPLRARFAFATRAGVPVLDPRVRWLVVGWGSRSFYTATGTYADLRLSTIWTAVTGDRATIHLDVAGDVTDLPDILYLDLNETQLAALTEAILASLTRDAAGQPVTLPVARFGPTDAFFAAEGHFSALTTCNVWVGQMLRAAGLDFGIWTPTPQAVAFSAHWFGLTPP